MSDLREPSDLFKQSDGRSYDDVAELYDLFTERYTGPIARRMADMAQLGASSQVLDVGTGSGVFALEIARRLGPAGRIFGIDLSAGMLATATCKAEARGLSDRAHFQTQDAEELDFADCSFDHVLSLYALFHFPDPRRAIGEMFRVLRPGGSLVLGVGSSPPFGSLRGLLYLTRRLPFAIQQRRGRWLAAPTFLDRLVEERLGPSSEDLESQAAMRRHAGESSSELPAMLRACGFVDVRTRAELGLGILPDPEEFWDLQRVFSSKARKRLSTLAGDELEALRNEFFARSRDVLAAGGRLVYPYAAFILVARRPS
jgi:O-methyltransferase/aklanonic acid methyltransferase